MFLHASFTTKEKMGMMACTRIALCWAIIRSRHPLLMSKVTRDQNSNNSSTSVEEPYFWFSPPKDAVKEAKDCLVFDTKSKDDLISNYLNGPRTLSDERMSYLVISNPMESIYDDGHNGQFELLMCAPHFIGDGASLHQCTHEFVTLLASPQSSYDLLQILTLPLNWVDLLPPALESRIQIPSSGIARAAAKVNYLQTMYNEIGGHTLRRTQRSPQKTILIEKSFTESQTKKILAKCKQNGVTVNHALFALCNVAWGQSNLDFKAIREPL
ncbi:hypothetical protein D9757_012394 [Collybiopsis confluens]|uniref:Uncharacterized protein n=1 Tax=Collybiopsis confluens TaxID=2823264 RepID=A0A8H5GJG5_9AGAR|nr:hypothetical protein D9757_012394 [Collybiopsis confluens]